MLFDENYYMSIVVNMIVDDPVPHYPRELLEPMIDNEMLQDFALTLREQYPNAVRQSIWTSINLRRDVDLILDESAPIVKTTVFSDRFFSETERQEILNRCAEIIRKNFCVILVHVRKSATK